MQDPLFTQFNGTKSSPIIVFLHGFMGSHQDFYPLARSLPKKYNTVVLDLPGHGQSADSPLDSIDHFLDAIHTTLNRFMSYDIHWVGYSLGGRLIPYLAPHYKTQSALWVSTKLLPLSYEEKKARFLFEQKILKLFREESFGNFLTKWYDQPLFKTLKNNLKLYETIYKRRLHECPSLMEKVFKLTSPLAFEKKTNLMNHWDYSKLYVAGKQDTKYRSEAQSLQKDSGKFSIQLFEHSSHALHLEQPDALASLLLNFLEEQS